jgi:hypothetical protein
MRFQSLLIALAAVVVAGSAEAAVKLYNSSADNGTPGDFVNTATNLCPPVQTSPNRLQGFTELTDDGTGTVTMNDIQIELISLIDLGPDQLTLTYGPGAFIFIDSASTTVATPNQTSNTSGIGAHGPSGTAPGQSAEWGIVTGWIQTGFQYCVSSPTAICDGANFAHGQTILPIMPSDTYNLGTWNFDAAGDYSAPQVYVQRTSNGGLQNSSYLMRGAFQGASLPALPLVGFGALALSLAVIGGRAVLGKK